METKSPLLTLNLSSLLLLLAGFAVAGSWWLDHKRLKEEIAIETANQRVVLRDARTSIFIFSSSEDDEYVYGLSWANLIY